MSEASVFIGPWFAALREVERHHAGKRQGILYTMSELLHRMASMYQHLLGQPLAMSRLALEDLEEQLAKRDPDALPKIRLIREQLDCIDSSSDRFCESLPGSIDCGATNVSAAVAKALSVFDIERIKREEDILIETDIADDAYVVYASELLGEHIYNLLNNSLYAVRRALAQGNIQEGRIVVQVRAEEVCDRLQRSTGSELITFRISDNGTGAPKDCEAKIEKPGFTTKKGYGSGYGLFAAADYVSSLGGRFGWVNHPGQGFVVEFMLQRYNERKNGRAGRR